jgi:hypothetical protein
MKPTTRQLSWLLDACSCRNIAPSGRSSTDPKWASVLLVGSPTPQVLHQPPSEAHLLALLPRVDLDRQGHPGVRRPGMNSPLSNSGRMQGWQRCRCAPGQRAAVEGLAHLFPSKTGTFSQTTGTSDSTRADQSLLFAPSARSEKRTSELVPVGRGC